MWRRGWRRAALRAKRRRGGFKNRRRTRRRGGSDWSFGLSGRRDRGRKRGSAGRDTVEGGERVSEGRSERDRRRATVLARQRRGTAAQRSVMTLSPYPSPPLSTPSRCWTAERPVS